MLMSDLRDRSPAPSLATTCSAAATEGRGSRCSKRIRGEVLCYDVALPGGNDRPQLGRSSGAVPHPVKVLTRREMPACIVHQGGSIGGRDDRKAVYEAALPAIRQLLTRRDKGGLKARPVCYIVTVAGQTHRTTRAPGT